MDDRHQKSGRLREDLTLLVRLRYPQAFLRLSRERAHTLCRGQRTGTLRSTIAVLCANRPRNPNSQIPTPTLRSIFQIRKQDYLRLFFPSCLHLRRFKMRAQSARWLYLDGLPNRLNHMDRVRDAVRHPGEVLDQGVQGHPFHREGRCAPWKVVAATLRATSAAAAVRTFAHLVREDALLDATSDIFVPVARTPTTMDAMPRCSRSFRTRAGQPSSH